MGLLSRASQKMLRNGAMFGDNVRVGLNARGRTGLSKFEDIGDDVVTTASGRMTNTGPDTISIGELSPEGRELAERAASMFDTQNPKVAAMIRSAQTDYELDDLLGRLYQMKDASVPNPSAGGPYPGRPFTGGMFRRPFESR